MNELTPEDARLDALLKTWSQDQAAHPATIERLQRSITATAVRPEAKRSGRSPAVAIWFTAACLFLAVFAGVRVGNQHKSADASAESKARLAALWKETGSLFGSNLHWLGDLDGELLLGLNGPHQETSDRVCVSLMLRVFNAGTNKWEDSWRGNFTCEGGSSVNFASSDKRSSGSIWVQSQPDGRFAVSHWLNWQEHPELSGPVDATVTPDKEQVVLEGVEEGRRIQVVQQVWRPDVG